MQVYGGRYLNDEEITGMLIATLFAGQHTSSITSSWTGLTMIRDKVRLSEWLKLGRTVKGLGDISPTAAAALAGSSSTTLSCRAPSQR